MSRKTLVGVVVTSSQKTVNVLVQGTKQHPIYKKYYKTTKKHLAHNELDDVKVGDMVQIEESKPISKRKKWKVINLANKN
jgi:small subunit ribosomal protein S17